MTNKEKFIEVFGEELQRQYITKSWWEQEYVLKTGHWIYNPYLSTHWADVYECSECKKGRSKIDCYNGTYLDEYCPKCGAKMEEEE